MYARALVREPIFYEFATTSTLCRYTEPVTTTLCASLVLANLKLQEDAVGPFG